MMRSLYSALAAALASTDVAEKLALTAEVAAAWQANELDWQTTEAVTLTCGCPAKPELVPPRDVPYRKPSTPEGRARLLHAIVHIEFSAINLALDHAARFRGMPQTYYSDWIGVAVEEAYHFNLLRDRLRELGHDYGDFPAHAGLWEIAEKTSDVVLARMALVPRLLEARGLDATPPIQQRLIEHGDTQTAALLDIILRDEIGHVGLGDRWFRHLCAERQLDVESTYRQLLIDYKAPRLQAPINENARLAAGFTASELAGLLKIV